MNRQEAHAQGLRYYNTGKPCRRGHTSDRYVGNGACVACLRCPPTDHRIYYFVDNNTTVVTLYVKKEDMELVKLTADSYIAAKFPDVKYDKINPFPFKGAKFISSGIYRIKVRVPFENAAAMEGLSTKPTFAELEKPRI